MSFLQLVLSLDKTIKGIILFWRIYQFDRYRNTYFDRNKETILQTDASKKGFGAVILQEEQPTMLRGLSHLQKRITRILNVRLKQQFGAWRNSTIFSMVESLFYKLIRNL